MTEEWNSLLAAHDAARDRTRTLVPEHAPRAAVLTCSDARVAPSIIFDQPAGSLFVVRVAGNTATAEAVASLDYAVSELGVDLLVVLGHTDCGAVAAACAGNLDEYLEPLTTTIRRLIDGDGCHDPDDLAARNVLATLTALGASDSPLGEAIRSGAVTVQGSIYDLAHDELHPLSTATPEPTAESKELARP